MRDCKKCKGHGGWVDEHDRWVRCDDCGGDTFVDHAYCPECNADVPGEVDQLCALCAKAELLEAWNRQTAQQLGLL